jgi:hypothetical protein
MNSRPVHRDSRSETGSAESVSWLKSRHSAVGAQAACVEVVLAVQRPDGSVVVEVPDRGLVMLVRPPSLHSFGEPGPLTRDESEFSGASPRAAHVLSKGPQLDEPQTESVGAKLALISDDPAFAQARQDAIWEPREARWVDPVSYVTDPTKPYEIERDADGEPVLSEFGRPKPLHILYEHDSKGNLKLRDGEPVPQRFVVRSAFDARRFSANGEKFTDLTVQVRADGKSMSHEALAGMWDAAKQGVEEFYNQGERLTSTGDRLHVTIELVRPDQPAHLTVGRAKSVAEMNQHEWFPGAKPVVIAHELSHQLGTRDEYRGPEGSGIEHRPNITGSLVGDYRRPIDTRLPRLETDDELKFQGLRGRHLDLIDRIVGDEELVGPRPAYRQPEPTLGASPRPPRTVTGGRPGHAAPRTEQTPGRHIPSRDEASSQYQTDEYELTSPYAKAHFDDKSAEYKLAHAAFAYRDSTKMVREMDEAGLTTFTPKREVIVPEHPTLRVTADGSIAVAADAPGSHEFYALPEVVESANARLKLIKSNVSLAMHDEYSITMAHGDEERVLYKVAPQFKSSPTDVCRDFSEQVLGGRHTHVVLSDTTQDGGGRTSLGRVRAIDQYEISGVSDLIDQMMKAVDEGGMVDIEDAARVFDQAKLVGAPTPGEAYGKAVATWGFDEPQARMGLGGHAYGQVGESYVIMSVPDREVGATRMLDRDYSILQEDADYVPKNGGFGYHFGAIVSDAADRNGQVVIQNVNSRSSTRAYLDEAIDRTIGYNRNRLPRLVASLERSVAANDPRLGFARSLLDVQRLNGEVAEAGHGSAGAEELQRLSRELQSARTTAQKALSSYIKDSFGFSGDQWFITLHGRAPGESFFEGWTGAGTGNEAQSAYVNPTSVVMLGGHEERRAELEFQADTGGLTDIAAQRLAGLGGSVARTAMWSARNDVPLPQLRMVLRAEADEDAGAAAQREQAVYNELRYNLKTAFDETQDIEPLPGGLRLRPQQIVVSRDIEIVRPGDESGVVGSSVLVESAMHGAFDESLPPVSQLRGLAAEIKLQSARSGPTASDVAHTAQLVRIGRQVFGRGAEDSTDRIHDLRRAGDVLEREFGMSGPLTMDQLDTLASRVFRKAPGAVDGLDRRNLLDAVSAAKRSGSKVTGADISRAAAATRGSRAPGAVSRELRQTMHRELAPTDVNALLRRAEEINQEWNRYEPQALGSDQPALAAERQDAIAQIAYDLHLHDNEGSAVALAQQLNARRTAGGATVGAGARSPHSLGNEDQGTVGASARSPHSLETDAPTTHADESATGHTVEPGISLESKEPTPAPIEAHAVSVHAAGVAQVHEQPHHGEQQVVVPPVVSVPVPVRDLSSPRFNGVPDGVGWSHARLARSWGLEFDPRVGTAYDALLTAGGGSIPVGDHVLDDPDVLRQELGGQLGVVEPSAEDWSAAAEHLGASVLVLHGDGTMSAHGEGPVLVVTESAPRDGDAVQRWVGVPTSSEGPALSGLSAAQVRWAASAGKRFGGSGGGFFDALADAGRASAVPELDYAPQVLRDRLVSWMSGGLPDETWDRILGQAGIAAPHDDFARQQVIADVRLGGGDSVHLLPVLAGLHYGVGVHVVDTDGTAQAHGASDAQRSVTLVPAVGSQGHSWFTVGEVRPPRLAGAGTRPADVAGGLGWADSRVPVTDAPVHVGVEPSDAQVEWAYDHGRQLVEIPPGPDARFDALLQAVGGGFTAHGEYVGDPARLRELLADEVRPALEQDLGLALVVHTIYSAHTGSGDALIDSAPARDEIVEAIRNPEYRPGLADELVPYFANRLGLGVRTVDPSGVVGRYGSGRPVYVTWTADEGGQRHWTAATSESSKYALGSPLRAPNQSDPALFLLTQAIEARKGALRSGGTGEIGSDPVIQQLRDAQTRWLEHGPAPRSSVDEPIAESWHPENLQATVTRLVQSVPASIDELGHATDVVLGSGLHAGTAVELFNGLFPQGIGHESATAEDARGGVPADHWVMASLPDLVDGLPEGGAALFLGGDRTVVVLDTPEGQRLVEFRTDGVGGPITGRVVDPATGLAHPGDGLALVVDGGGHPLSAEQLYDTHGQDFDPAVGWSFGTGVKPADLELGAPVGVSEPQAAWAQRHGAEFVPVESGLNAKFDAVIKAAGGVLSAHGVDVTDPAQLRQALAEHLRELTAAPNTLRDLPSIHAAFVAEGADRVIEEFFDQNASGANAHAVARQLDEHIDSGKAAAYVAQAVAEPNHWEQVAHSVALDLVAHWSEHGILSVDPHGQVRLHGDPDAPRLAVGRVGADSSDWFALTPEHDAARSFADAPVDTVTSLTSSMPRAESGEDSFYHAVLDASGGAVQIDRDTLVTTPAELKAQLTTMLLDRPDVLDAATRESIEREAGIDAHAGADELVDALADPDSREGEVVARHLIGSYLGKELKVVEPDGTEHTYGTGRPLEIKTVEDELGGSRWTASPSLGSRDLDLDPGRHEQEDSRSAVEAERVGQAPWAPDGFDLKAPDEVEAGDPWRSASFCAEVEIDGEMQKACVSVAVLTLDAELAAQLGVAMP